jgi:hypothetical protein
MAITCLEHAIASNMIRAAVREATSNAHWFLFIKNETDLPEICWDLKA